MGSLHETYVDDETEETVTASSEDARKNPSVTVAIPVLNEAKYIDEILDVFLNSTYDNITEILVADGGSTDGTCNIVEEYAERDGRVRLIDNPDRIQSSALNRMLKEAQGDIFLRADAHCIYSKDYVKRNVKALLESNALNSGGAQRFTARNAFQAGVAMASLSVLGSGGAHYRNPEYTGYADTVFLGCFWTKALKKIGGFSHLHPTNEDAEVNLRLLQEKEDAVYIDSNVQVWYYPRDNIKSFLKQYFWYGWGRALTNFHHGFDSSPRGYLPFIVFWLFIIATLGEFLMNGTIYAGGSILASYSIGTIIESLHINIRYNDYFNRHVWLKSDKEQPSFLTRCFFTVIALISGPTAHAVGYTWQMLNKLLGTSQK